MAFNFNKVCSNTIPAGKYKVQVTDVKFKSNSMGESSKDVVVTYTIVDGPLAKRVFPDGIPEKAFSFRLKPFLTACKVDLNREFNTAEELFKYGFKECKDKIILVDLTVSTYNGREFNNISNWYPLPDSSTSSDEVLKAFNVEPTVKAPDVELPQTPEIPKAEDLVEPQLDVPNLDGSDTEYYTDNDLPF